MINLNRYKPGSYPDGENYINWRKVNAEMIGNVEGRILWSLQVKGTLLVNGKHVPKHEILAYRYPSHKNLLGTKNYKITEKNFELRQKLVDYAIIYRYEGDNPPILKK